jgi:hypothetical protein
MRRPTERGVSARRGGWHYRSDPGAFINGVQIMYAFVGDPDHCVAGGLPGPSPNNDPGGDAMANTFAHELAEAVTDPLILESPAFFGTGGEIADMCANRFGTTYKLANGATAKMKVNGKDYYIQEIFDPIAFKCAD